MTTYRLVGFIARELQVMGDKGTATRERILEKALQLFQHKGFGGTSISDILDSAGIKKGTLYFHFTSKDEIGFTVLKRASSELSAFLDSVLVGDTALAKLDSYFIGILESQRRLKFIGGCIFGNAALEMSDSNALYADYISQVFEQWIETIRSIVAAAQSSGDIRGDIPAEALARQIVAATEGAIMLARIHKHEHSLNLCFTSLRQMLAPVRTK